MLIVVIGTMPPSIANPAEPAVSLTRPASRTLRGTGNGATHLVQSVLDRYRVRWLAWQPALRNQVLTGGGLTPASRAARSDGLRFVKKLDRYWAA